MSTPAAEHAPGRPEADGFAARTRGLTKAYGSGETTVLALDSVDVDIARGRFTAVMGPRAPESPPSCTVWPGSTASRPDRCGSATPRSRG
ncbi:hypothetical protein SAV31267_018270 [Streptomyces avermitilis]|uniref:ABC transporter domain-containing protein n=1 Tax=Streptomyces avermitilis TaxID=33903 RepID=A0A4D4MJS8_STRAX|nr:hypothetical protein SAV31267_018270 [Streptomyces avermitilis]